MITVERKTRRLTHRKLLGLFNPSHLATKPPVRPVDNTVIVRIVFYISELEKQRFYLLD